MQNKDLCDHSLTELVELLRKREVSAREVVEAHLEQISRLNPQLNAIVTLNSDALEQADLAGGELAGLPITIKDTIETAGLRTTSGSRLRDGYVPVRDAPAVARLKAAGAIVIGKTNAAEMAMDYNADNPVFGRTVHFLDPKLTPGGSSGGEAVAIATHMSPGGLGSDLAGSIRIPAHFCGVCGLKPTTGRVPGDGQFPPSTGPYGLGAVIGPLARRVADLRLLCGVLVGQRELNTDLKGTHFAWYSDDNVVPVTNDTARAVANTAAALRDAGLIGEERRPPHVERGNE